MSAWLLSHSLAKSSELRKQSREGKMKIRNSIVSLESILIPSGRNAGPGYFLQLQSGLNVVYGKNGVGKSTLIDGLTRWAEPSESHPVTRFKRNRPPRGVARSAAEAGHVEMFVSIPATRGLELVTEWVRNANKLLRQSGRVRWHRAGSRLASNF